MNFFNMDRQTSTMDNEIRIYMNDRVVILTDKNIKSPAINNDPVFIFENRQALAKQLERFEKSDEACIYITHPNLNELFGYVAGCFKYVEAAGGLVTLSDGRILLIERLGKWDLPKGKAEKGESLQETAIREVVEECGLKTPPKITGELTHTFHTYHRDGRHVLKHTAWYTMCYDGDENLHPQFAEDITQAVWLPQNRLNIVVENTYESIKQVLEKFKE